MDPAVDVVAPGVGLEEAPGGQRVAEVVDPRAPRAPDPGPAEDFPEPCEGLLDGVPAERRCPLGPEEVIRAWDEAQGVPARGVAGEALNCRRVERDEARLSELPRAHREEAGGQIDVATLEPPRLGQTHSGGREQGEEGGVGRGAQAVARAKGPARTDQRDDLLVGADVRGRVPREASQEPGGRDLGVRIERGAMLREGADGSEAPLGTGGVPCG